MFTHKEIESIFSDLSDQASVLAEFQQATTPYQVQLSSEMAAALGTPYRRLVPVLATVVDVISAKLEIDDDELKLAKVADTKAIKKWLSDAKWSQIERELYAKVVRDGKAYILVTWQNDAPKFTIREAYNGLCGAHVVCEGGQPYFGWNTWSADGASYFDVFYSSQIEKYIKPAGDGQQWQQRQDIPDEEWPLPWVDENGQPLGIALIEFCIGGSDVEDAVQIGRDLNETLLDMLATSRTQGWPQRWIKGMRNPGVLTNDLGQPVISSVTRQPIRQVVSYAPGSILQLGENADMGQLSGATPDPTLFDKLLELLSLVTTVSSHYLTGQWPSGIALIQAESRLNHKVEGHQGRLSTAVDAVLRLAMRLSNHFGGTSFNAEQPIVIPWCAPQVETEDLRQERAKFQMDTIATLVTNGLMSKEVAIRELHPEWSEEEIQAELVRLGVAQPVQPTDMMSVVE